MKDEFQHWKSFSQFRKSAFEDPCTKQEPVLGQRAANCQQRKNNIDRLVTLDKLCGDLSVSTDTGEPRGDFGAIGFVFGRRVLRRTLSRSTPTKDLTATAAFALRDDSGATRSQNDRSDAEQTTHATVMKGGKTVKSPLLGNCVVKVASLIVLLHHKM